MSENNENNENEEFDEEFDKRIVLEDEEGNEVEFQLLDMINLDSENYVVLLPVDEEDEEEDGEVVILKLEYTESDEEQSYVSVDDEDLLNEIFEIFKEKFKNEYNFIEDDEEES